MSSSIQPAASDQAATVQPTTETGHLPALKYITSISSRFSAQVPPDDANYDFTASQTTFKNDNPATDQENTQAILQFVRQKLHIEIWPTNNRDAFIRARDSTVRLPTVDMFLGGEGIGARVMRGVSGSMRLPDSAQATSTEARSVVELDVTLVDGSELDKKFDTTIYFDARPEGMLFEAGTQAGEDEGEVSTPGRFFGRVVLPPSIPRTELLDLALLLVSPSWPTALAQQRTVEPERHSEQESDSGSEGSLAPTYAETATRPSV